MSTVPLPNGYRSDLQPALQRRLAQLHSAMGSAAEGPTTIVDCPSAPAFLAQGPSAVGAPARPTKPWVAKCLFHLGGLLALGLVAAVVTQGERKATTTEATPATTGVPAKTPALASAPAVSTPAAAPSEDEAIRDTLERWRLDWSRRDVPAYLAHYSPEFQPAGGIDRAMWEAQRRQALLNRPAIRVEIQGQRIERSNDQEARVHFRQTYLSGRYQEMDQPKTLYLRREDGRWRIAGEWQGDGPSATAHKP